MTFRRTQASPAPVGLLVRKPMCVSSCQYESSHADEAWPSVSAATAVCTTRVPSFVVISAEPGATTVCRVTATPAVTTPKIAAIEADHASSSTQIRRL